MQKNTCNHRIRDARVPSKYCLVSALLTSALFSGSTAHAFQISTDNPDVRVLWDTTVKYSTATRLEDQKALLIADTQGHWPNTDDGNRNFDKGLISNRLDLLTELDFIYKRGFGFRISGSAWYDTVYNGSNDNDSPATNNNLSTAYDKFTDDTKALHGSNAELLDAFLFGRFSVGENPVTFRIGRHTLTWGESLFLGANGIANAQAPINVVKAQSVPNTQFKELMRPVNQISGQIQLTPDVSLGAYYQLEWEKTLLPGAGSYFSGVDFLSEGGETMLLAPDGSAYFQRADDVEASDSGQGGLQLRFRTDDFDYGLYAVNYHEKAPQINVLPGQGDGPAASGFKAGEFRWLYPENIQAYGASATTTFGAVNYAAEVSLRRNTPLSSDAAPDVTGTADNDKNPLYGVGNSVHAQMSWLASFGPSFLSKEASFVGEIGWNRVTSITKNRDLVNINATRSASNVRMVYEPKYRQALPGWDLTVPLGVGYGIKGNSMAVGSFLGEGIGDLSVGVNGTYLDQWRLGAVVTHYFGSVDNAIDAVGHGSYKQSNADRDFLSLSLHRTF